MNPNVARSLRYGQIATYAFAALCAFLAILELCGGFQLGAVHLGPRWEPSKVTFPLALSLENYFFLGYAILLCLPWQKTPSNKSWGWWFFLVCAGSIVFAFAMISEVMAKNYIAQGMGSKARLPVFQANLLFFALGQIPLALFRRKPELLS
jgi:hypothetical protein